jgi:pimeloyl-ACP methyl ester carboxylesterase
VHEDIEFAGEGGISLRGRFFRPDNATGPLPTVVLQSGIGDLAEMLWPLTPWFLRAGFSVLSYDQRNLGRSGGAPRQEVDPWLQARDLRYALSYLQNRGDVDGHRLGLWGMSMGAAVSLLVAAIDWRVGAVVAVAPPTSGLILRDAVFPGAELVEVGQRILADRLARARGEEAATVPAFVAADSAEIAVFRDDRALATIQQIAAKLPHYVNEVTLSSLDRVLELELGGYAPRVTAPAMLAVAEADEFCLIEHARSVYAALNGPKEIHEFPGTHHDALTTHLPKIGPIAIDFLSRHLDSALPTRDENYARELRGEPV